MIITNTEPLISNLPVQASYARKTILNLLEIGVSSVLPKNIIPKLIQVSDDNLIVQDMKYDLSKIDNVYIVGAGKASGAMAEAIEPILQSYITDGLVNIPEGLIDQNNTRIIQLNEATHPIPSKKGISGTRKIIEILNQTNENDLVLVLLSGGGSALLPLPAESIPLKQFQALNEFLIKSGATIQEINIVRKHCSQVKGGQLAKIGYPATILTLILSDVIGNPLDSIASGPTVPDPSTFRQSIEILKNFNLWAKIDTSIQVFLQQGLEGIIPETPKPSDKIFRKVQNLIIGDVKSACESIKHAAHENGYQSLIYSTEISGEARDVGKKVLQKALESQINALKSSPKPNILIAGGEPTVTVKGKGLGGRCQEMGLSVIAQFLDLPDLVFAAMGTDGIDGFTDVAGVIIDQASALLMKEQKMNPEKYLENNDSYHFFKRLKDSLIMTGPTGTNVNDLILVGIF